MPRLWNETIEAHRRDVRDAILDAAGALVADRGLLSVTMTHIAEETGIGRATLYKYFSDVDAILVAWHERLVTAHLRHLAEVRKGAGDPGAQLEAVLETYALMTYGRPHDTELATVAHRGAHVAMAQQHLNSFVEDLLIEAVKTGEVRSDVAPRELASYCVNALAAARGMASQAAVRRLLTVTLAGLRP